MCNYLILKLLNINKTFNMASSLDYPMMSGLKEDLNENNTLIVNIVAKKHA